jgi:type VI secretion system protein ImpM
MSALMTTIAASPPGWFGKLPGLGDFASRRLPEDFIQRWDDWLQQGLGACREVLGPPWLALYLVAPVQRFTLAPGVLGPMAWGGLVMSSVDRVGRHFPLTLAAPVGSAMAARADAGWYDALEACARRVLDLQRSVEDLEADLAALPAAPDDEDATVADAGGSLWWHVRRDGRASAPRRYAGLPPPSAFVAVLRHAARVPEDLP